MGISRCITWAMLKVMESKGNKSMVRMDKNSLDAAGSNERLLMQILRDNADTEYGRKYDFANIHSVAEYQEKVPYTTYDDYAPL